MSIFILSFLIKFAVENSLIFEKRYLCLLSKLMGKKPWFCRLASAIVRPLPLLVFLKSWCFGTVLYYVSTWLFCMKISGLLKLVLDLYKFEFLVEKLLRSLSIVLLLRLFSKVFIFIWCFKFFISSWLLISIYSSFAAKKVFRSGWSWGKAERSVSWFRLAALLLSRL